MGRKITTQQAFDYARAAGVEPRDIKNLPSIRQVVDELAGKPPKWDTRVQDADESRRMRAYMRFAERNAGGPVSGMCGTCAFRAGTEANASGAVLDMIEQSMLLGGMFNCHHGAPVNEATGCIEDGAEPVRPCRGFLALRNRNAADAARPGGPPVG